MEGTYANKKKRVETSYLIRVAQLKLLINNDALGLKRRE